jgi:flagellar biogenesis protein FliO
MTRSIPLSRAVAQGIAGVGFCLLAFTCPSVASAFTPPNRGGGENTPLNLNSSGAGSAHTSSGGASIVRTIVGLAIVIAVIWGLAWILRQVKASREGGRRSGRSTSGLASVAALTLGSGRSVHLVRAGNEYVLLGSAEHGLVPINRYTEQQAREAGLLEDATATASRSRRSLLTALPAAVTAHTGTGLRDDASPPIYEAGPVVHDLGNEAREPRRDVIEHVNPPDSVRPPDSTMRPSSPSSDLVTRLREWTVRR